MAGAGQALTSAPMGPWPRLAPMVAAIPTQAPGRQRWPGLMAAASVEDEHPGRQDQPVQM